jgi:hypothetical protein
MLTIRKEQMFCFEEAQRTAFIQRVQADLRKALTEAAVAFTEPVLCRQVEIGVQRASEIGLCTERDVARYIRVVCCELNGFTGTQHPPAARAVLMRYGMDATSKLDRFEAWARAFRRSALEGCT